MIRSPRFFSLLLLAFLVSGTAQAAGADDGVRITHGWIGATPKAGVDAKGYLTLHDGGEPDRLLKVSCPVAARTTIRNREGDTLAGLALAPNETVVLRPEGPHLLLARIHFPLYPHALIPCSATFRNAGPIMLYLHVEPAGVKPQELAG